ncbi:Far1-related sequence [Thalictrum thalictroides]|uniref:Far1-related sequence n=1 Tax=Thalictrum thalictroides TaxID=46969 RepID=A0A7J6X587_THATH|nr:Far1-related sequence [Thalictrum thalictroides]
MDEISQQSSDQLDSEGGDHDDDDDQNTLHFDSQSDGNASESQPSNIFTAEGDGPALAMLFHSETQAYDYYNAYAKSAGFSIRRSKMVMRKDKTVTRRVFCCSKEGFRCKHPRGDPMRPRPLTRTGCKARLGIHLQAGKYIVNEFVQEHNHPLACPSQAHMLRSQRKNQDPQPFNIDDVLSYLGEQTGAPQDLNLVEGDSNNYLQRWCCEILKKAQEDKKKIRELSAELQRERRQSATYREQLHMVLKEMEDHTNHLSKQVESIVYNVKELEPRGSKEVS